MQAEGRNPRFEGGTRIALRTLRSIRATQAEARHRVGLSQAQFAGLLEVSKRTLQDWEQGRREPSGAVKALLKIAEKRPDVLCEILGSTSAVKTA